MNPPADTLTADDGAALASALPVPEPLTASELRSHHRRQTILTAPVFPTLLKLALPTMTVLLAQTAVNIAEGYYVGLLGTDALAGVALVFPVFMLMTMMSNGGLGSGVASAVARAFGAGLRQDADALVFHAVVLGVLFGLVFTLGPIWGGSLLYRSLGGHGAALEAALKYSNYLFAGAIPVWIVNMQAAALRGSGNVKVPATVTLVGAMVLIPTSPILIFGLGPIPALGIAGAGIAFAAYYCAAMLVLLRYMSSGHAGLAFKPVPLRIRFFNDILRVGIPTAFNAALTNVTVIAVTGAVGLFGTVALAGYGIASRLDYILIPILFGIASAVLTMVGVNIGAGQIARAEKIAWSGSFMGLAITETIGLTVAVFPMLWLRLFSHDADVLSQGADYLRIVAPVYGAFGFGFAITFVACRRRQLDRCPLFPRRHGHAGLDGGHSAYRLRVDLRLCDVVRWRHARRQESLSATLTIFTSIPKDRGERDRPIKPFPAFRPARYRG